MKGRKTFKILYGSQTILQEIQQEFQEKKKQVAFLNPQKTSLLKDSVVQGSYFQYIPKPIQEYIINHDWKYGYRIQQGFPVSGVETGSVKFTLHIYTDYSKDPSLDILSIFLLLLERVQQKSILQPEYELYYYATPFLKYFPEKTGELIDEIHANSGFTVKASPIPIYVFRKEECQRVCIHEMLHAFGFDGINQKTGRGPAEGTECLNLLRNINGEHLCDRYEGVRIYEALTETQATILNILFKNPKSLKSLFQSLKQERTHVHYQIQQLQSHYRISSENYSGYKQGLSKTISYFLFRGFLMDELNRFIQNNLLSPQSTDYVDIIQEGLQKQGVGKGFGHKTQNVIRGNRMGKNRKTLKMNYSA